jgi:predicted ABC-type ATPase
MANTKPKIILIAGCNGAGKSTLAPHLLRDAFNLKDYVNADTIAQGLSAFAPENAAIEAGKIMLRRLRELARQKKSFAFETTLASRFYVKFIEELKAQNFEFHLLFLWLESSELAILRVAERVSAGGHNVPEETIRRRYERGLQNFFKLYQPIADTWALFDANALDKIVLIANGGNDSETEIFDDNLWQRICERAE